MPRPNPDEPRFDHREFDRPAQPTVSVVIPSADGHRGGNVELLLDSLQEQTHRPCEILIAIGVRPNGRARNRGAERVSGDYIVFIDDDVEIQDEELIEKIVRLFQDHSGKVGAVGPAQRLMSYSNDFQRRCGVQLERVTTPIVEEPTESDLVTHACLAIPRDLYWEIGGESEVLPRGTDPDLRNRLRNEGYSILLVPNTSVGHPAPENWEVLFDTAFRNGEGSAQVGRYYSKYSLPTSADYLEPMREAEDFFARARGWAARTGNSIGKGHWIRLGYELAYLAGWFSGKTLDFNRNKILLKRAAKVPISGFNQIKRLKTPTQPALRILTYHRVDDIPDYPLCIPQKEFRRQIEYLLDQSLILDFEEAMRVIRGERTLKRNQVAITFDDGYRDNFTNAYRILSENNIQACFFLTTDRIGGLGEFEWVKKLGLPNYHIMNWEQVKCMLEAGMVIGAHTARHERLSLLHDDESRSTIEESLQTIESELGIQPKYFAYPYGRMDDYGDREVKILRENQVEFAFSATYGAIREKVDTHRIPRVNIDPSDTFETFKCKIYGDFDFLGEWRP
ncbi:MAG: polysaccharide deacetylase family protein [Candidatus Omnitrophica bacterium]|nr:polysaccharide deacetylase family protein [Candidatus Omnitrophota bacterium]